MQWQVGALLHGPYGVPRPASEKKKQSTERQLPDAVAARGSCEPAPKSAARRCPVAQGAVPADQVSPTGLPRLALGPRPFPRPPGHRVRWASPEVVWEGQAGGRRSKSAGVGRPGWGSRQGHVWPCQRGRDCSIQKNRIFICNAAVSFRAGRRSQRIRPNQNVTTKTSRLALMDSPTH